MVRWVSLFKSLATTTTPFNEQISFHQNQQQQGSKVRLQCALTFKKEFLLRLYVIDNRVPTFSDCQNSMIFPGFFSKFPGIFSLFLKYDFQVVLNINMQTY